VYGDVGTVSHDHVARAGKSSSVCARSLATFLGVDKGSVRAAMSGSEPPVPETPTDTLLLEAFFWCAASVGVC
jgi:hypothetical protein